MSRIIIFVSFFFCSLALPQNGGIRSNDIYPTVANIMSLGYHAETHHVTTTDGYVLELHRIPYKRYQQDATNRRPVVFLMHGLMSASNSFILLGSEYSVAYNLADAGFDVWMGNARGNVHSRFHVTLDPDDEEEKFEFFDFSFEEIGIYDLPAVIDYILEYTGSDKLHYIGHSQGGTAFLVLGSMRPEYNEKLASVNLLAAVGYQDYFPNSAIRTMAAMTSIIYSTSLAMGIVELTSLSLPGMTSRYNRNLDYCFDESELHLKYLCQLTGVRSDTRNETSESDISQSLGPAGASMKQIAHYGQNIRDTSFRRWTYGTLQNLDVYGANNPPIYNLSLITANVTMHYSLNDSLLDERDALAMADDMPNTIARKVARDSFLHEDYVVALDAKELVTDYIIEVIESMSQFDDTEIDDPDMEDVVTVATSAPTQPIPESVLTDSAYSVVLGSLFKIYLIIHSMYIMLK